MSFTWPQFVTPQPLDGSRTWTANFDSYDQYRDDCYYCVRLFDGTELVIELMAQLSMGFAGDDWRGPTFVEEVRAQLARVAAAGATNTSWAGYHSRRTPHDLTSFRAVHPFTKIHTTTTTSADGRWDLRHLTTFTLHVAGDDRGMWQYDLVDRTNGCVVRTWSGPGQQPPPDESTAGVRTVRFDGDVLVVITVDGTEARVPPGE
jgi:hypothetical protein